MKNPIILTSFWPNKFPTIFVVKSKLSNAEKCRNPTFSRVFHPNICRQFFSWNQSCQKLKRAEPQCFHEFLTQKVFDNFSREIKVVKSWKVQIHTNFTSFSLKYFSTIFLVKSKLLTTKKCKTPTFSRIFRQFFSWN